MSAKMLKESMKYQVSWENYENRRYVDGRVVHPARLGAWIECAKTMANTEVGQSLPKQNFLATFHGKY